MENKNKNKKGSLKKLALFLIMLLLTLFSVSGGQLLYDQDDLLEDITGNIGNVRVNVVLGNLNVNTTLLSGSQVYDIYYEYNELHNDIYYIIDNGIANTTATFIWNFQKSQTETRFTQNFTMTELGTYVFKINNNVDGEALQLFMDFPETWVGYVYEQQEIKQGLPDVIAKGSNYAMALISINMTLWTLGFYVIVFAFVIGCLLLIIWLSIKFYNWAKEHRLFKNRSNHK